MNKPLRTKEELARIFEIAHAIRVENGKYSLIERSLDQDHKYILEPEEMDLVHPMLREMVKLLLRRPGTWQRVECEEAMLNIKRVENPTLITTKRGEKLYVAELTKVDIAKGIVRLEGSIYRVERFDIRDGVKPTTFYATNGRDIGRGFSIGLEVLTKQYPDFRDKLDILKGLDIPAAQWPLHLFAAQTQPTIESIPIPADFSY